MIWACIIGGLIGFIAGKITKKLALWVLLLELLQV